MKTFIQFFNLTKPLHLCESTLRSFFSPSEQSLPVGLSSQQKSQSLMDGLGGLMKSEYSAMMESEQKKLRDFQNQY